MKQYFINRFLYMILLLATGSMISFLIIVLPPGDYVTSYVQQLEAEGAIVGEAEIEAMRMRYGLDSPTHVQYFKWISNVMRGDLGYSFEHNRRVSDVIGERLVMTLVVTIGALFLTYLVAIPIGIFSAVRQYSLGDYVFTAVSFFGVSIPDFLLALVLIIVLNRFFGLDAGGLFSMQYRGEPWSWGKFVDLLRHLPLPLLVIGLSGTASITRIMRAMLLDELQKPYVMTARAKGLSERKLIVKYPVRVALNPIVSSMGWALPAIFSGQTIVSVVLNLPTIGPLLYYALLTQDMFLAASTILIGIALTAVGMLLSDIALAWLDPRIRLA